MKLSRRFTTFLLGAMFLAAVAARVSTTDRRDSPYYKGSSAMTYRHALAVADGASLRAHDEKAGSPEGYVPSRYRAAGVETMTGLAFRAARFVSDMDARQFTRRLSLLVAALCVFTTYAVAARVWDSRGAGLLAAFLTAFLPTLVEATNGRAFSHAGYAAFFASLHAALSLRALWARSRAALAGAAAVALVLLSAWEPATWIVALWVVPVALSRSLDRTTRIAFAVSHALAVGVAGALFPHLVATRALAGWAVGVVASAAVVAMLPDRARAGWRAGVWLPAGALAYTLLAAPIRAGATEQFPALAYVLTRLRYAFGRPEPSLLSDWMRHLWSLDHAPLTPYQLIQLFLPLGLCTGVLFFSPETRARRGRFAAAVAVLVAAAAAVALDRSAIPVACVAMIPMVAGCVRASASGRLWPIPILFVTIYAAFAGVVFEGKSADPAFRIARAAGVVAQDPYGFVWVSLENTDRELVRFVSTRTSVHDSMLASEDLSALLLAFTGRTSVQLCGTTSRAPAEKHAALTRAFYQDEAGLYSLCREVKIDYVVYSIDLLLDNGEYSPLYLAGAGTVDPQAIAVRMHFEPESIEHFTLVYENDHYRLFKVTDSMQPVFLTDHPLFYQRDVFTGSGRDLQKFREACVFLMLSYADAISARANGNAEDARRRLAACVERAPHFTVARLELANALMDLGRYEKAQEEVATVIGYAPDNPVALYDAAFIQVQLGRPESARPYLSLLLANTGDREMIERAHKLQSYIEQGLPLKPGAPQR